MFEFLDQRFPIGFLLLQFGEHRFGRFSCSNGLRKMLDPAVGDREGSFRFSSLVGKEGMA